MAIEAVAAARRASSGAADASAAGPPSRHLRPPRLDDEPAGSCLRRQPWPQRRPRSRLSEVDSGLADVAGQARFSTVEVGWGQAWEPTRPAADAGEPRSTSEHADQDDDPADPCSGEGGETGSPAARPATTGNPDSGPARAGSRRLPAADLSASATCFKAVMEGLKAPDPADGTAVGVLAFEAVDLAGYDGRGRWAASSSVVTACRIELRLA